MATEAAREFVIWSGILPPSAVQAFSVVGSAALHTLIDRLYRLALSLPPEPLLDFEQQVASFPRETEANDSSSSGLARDVFRKSLIDYWGGRCPITGMDQPGFCVPAISRLGPTRRPIEDASRCSTPVDAAHLDAAFDAALISFADDGA